MSQQTAPHDERGLAPTRRLILLQIVLGLAAISLGIALFLASVSVQTIALIAGIGLVVVGAAFLFTPVWANDNGARALPRIAGTLLVAVGGVMALWPDAGAPGLAFIAGAGLIGFGLVSGVQAIRSSSDMRVTALIAATATIVVGVLSFSWPVLTLVFFRLGVGAWLVFFGLHWLFGMLLEHLRTPTIRRPSFAPGWSRWVRTLGATLALAVAVIAAVGSNAILGGVPLPEPGAFYAVPASVPGAPGKLIRFEPLNVGVPEGAEAWKILYTTTHPDGSPAVSSGTVIAPFTRGDDPLPLLTVAHGTSGVVSKCAPSMSLTPFTDGAGTALTEMVTQHGWVAVLSDYIGLGTQGTHPYLIGDAEARNVLDASRAVQDLGTFETTTDTVVWGHSQGGQAALWTGQIAATYAPELTITGVAAFAPATDLFGLAEANKKNAPGKAVSAYIAATWNKIYPELALSRDLTPGSAGGVEKIQNLCFNGKDALATVIRGTQLPNQVFPNALLDGVFGEKLKQNAPVGPFPAPVLVAQGLDDPLVKPALQDAWVASRCEAGISIDYRTFAGRDHTSLVAADSPLTPEIVQWTLDRRIGKPVTPNCHAHSE
jgi:uncharacterized membrane protein HdeD (DUF308 family)/acetyl esterase/lipase